MLPNMSSTVKKFLQDVTHISISTTLVSGRPQETPTQTSIKAVVENPTPESLSQDQLRNSLRYKSVWTVETPLNIDDKIIHNGITYRIISPSDWSEYGYYETVAEEVKE